MSNHNVRLVVKNVVLDFKFDQSLVAKIGIDHFMSESHTQSPHFTGQFCHIWLAILESSCFWYCIFWTTSLKFTVVWYYSHSGLHRHCSVSCRRWGVRLINWGGGVLLVNLIIRTQRTMDLWCVFNTQFMWLDSCTLGKCNIVLMAI